MKERPILFTEDMYNKAGAGFKTQTRRVVMPQPAAEWELTGEYGRITSPHPRKGKFGAFKTRNFDEARKEIDIIPCPFGQPGDRLWVKEPFRITDDNTPTDTVFGVYTRDNQQFTTQLTPAEYGKYFKWSKKRRGKSSLYMFKSLTRLWLEITNIHIERLQDISTVSIKAEGIKLSRDEIEKRLAPNFGVTSEVGVYQGEWIKLWDSINKGRGYGWDVNPWVWVIEFKKV